MVSSVASDDTEVSASRSKRNGRPIDKRRLHFINAGMSQIRDHFSRESVRRTGPRQNYQAIVDGWRRFVNLPEGLEPAQVKRMLENQVRANKIRYAKALQRRRERAARERGEGTSNDAAEDTGSTGADEDGFHGFGEDDQDMAAANVVEMEEVVRENGGAELAALGAPPAGAGGSQAGGQLHFFAAPIYRGIKTGPMKFYKRWNFILPVCKQFAMGTVSGTTRHVLYGPGIYDFDVNRYGYYLSQTDLDWLNKLNKTTNAVVKHIRMCVNVDNANCPFNTNGTTQQSANSQLHIKCLKGRDISKLGPSVTGTVEYTLPTTGPYEVSKVRFDGAINGVPAFTALETSTCAGTTNIGTTNGIVQLAKPDATEGYRQYPFQHLWRCSYDNTSRKITNYPEYQRTMEVGTVGKGKLFDVSYKKNHLMMNQFYDSRQANFSNNSRVRPTVLSSYSLNAYEAMGSLAGKTANLTQDNYMIDNNWAPIGQGDHKGMDATCSPAEQIQLIPPPTTTDDIATAQAGYVAISMDCEIDIELVRDAINTTNDAAAGGTVASTLGMIWKFNTDLGAADGQYGQGAGAGVTPGDIAFSKWGPVSIKTSGLTNV